ncbi:MAG: hypothetical protein JWM10_1412, partial [Myxococcaceae bacterium]|nr:hypothetical protein [Myxococcaceae bacterium]
GATVSAAGGTGGPGGTIYSNTPGGNGGPGRIRVTAGTSTCTLAGTFSPALVSGCAPTPAPGTAGRAYVGAYPD